MKKSKEETSIEVAKQEEEIRKTQEIIINETLVNQAVKETEHQANVKKSSKKSLFGLLFVFLNIVLVVILGFTSFNQSGAGGATFGDMFKTWMKKENFWFWLIAMLLGLLSLFAEAMKFYVMIRRTTKKRKLWLSIKTAIMGKYYDNITPLGSGGQPFQIYYLSKGGVPGAEAMYLPVASFFLNQLAFLFLCIMAFIVNGISGLGIDNTTLTIMAYVGAAFSIAIPVAIFIASFMPKLRAKIIKLCVRISYRFKLVKNKGAATRKANKLVNDYRRSLIMLAKSKGTLLIIIILSLIYQISLCSIPYFVVRACGITEVNWFFSLCTCIFVYAAISFIPTPGNSGAAEVSFAMLFTMIIDSATVSKYWAMAYWRFCCYFLIVLIGVLFVIGGMIRANRQRKMALRQEKEEIEKISEENEKASEEDENTIEEAE